MRSILAGLRQLVVPWGRRHAPRIVIGGEDPIAQSTGQDSALVFYFTDTRAFLVATDTFGDFGTFYIYTAQQGSFISQLFEVTHRISTDVTERVDVAQSNVELLTLGLGCAEVDIGDSPDTTRVAITGTDISLIGTPQLGARDLGFDLVVSNQTPPPADTTVSGPVAWDTIGVTTATFTKQAADTDIEIGMSIGMFSTAGGTVGQYGISISGGIGDQLIGQVLLSSPSVENAASAVIRVTGVPAGTYTLTPRWRRTAGAGTLTITVSSASLSFYAREVIQP